MKNNTKSKIYKFTLGRSIIADSLKNSGIFGGMCLVLNFLTSAAVIFVTLFVGYQIGLGLISLAPLNEYEGVFQLLIGIITFPPLAIILTFIAVVLCSLLGIFWTCIAAILK